MPSATRNTNTNSGSEVSAPAKPNTCLNSSALRPRAAVNDSTTVAIRTSGATTARSSSIRIRNTTSSTTGMISRLSEDAARAVSSTIAVPPPTWASAPGTACTASRTRSTVSLAAWLSGGSASVPCRNASPPR